jgi:hypothetical protein
MAQNPKLPKVNIRWVAVTCGREMMSIVQPAAIQAVHLGVIDLAEHKSLITK